MSPADRAAEIVAGLTDEERLRLTSGHDFWHLEPLEVEGIGPTMITDGPHGLRKQRSGADHLGITDAVPATCFPVAATLAASWDTELLEEVGAALGAEAATEDVALVLGPGLNLKRHPAGGRNFEYFSEDPLLSGRLAAALVRGIQSRGVGACLKHFAANNQETRRMTVDTIVDERTMRELYLTGFEIAVTESRPWSVMCAYNRINGTYASDDRWLLTDVLRSEWGFDGFVVSDWGATATKAGSLTAGMDLEMPGNDHAWDAEAMAALADGALDPADLEASATRIVEFLLRQREADGPDSFDATAHHELGRRAAAAGAVLLTNDGTLPLAPDSRVALIGALAEHPRYQGAGSSLVNPTRLDTIKDAFGDADTFVAGCEVADGDAPESLLAQAVDAVEAADVAVVVVGLPTVYESEGFDRDTLALPDGHHRLVEAVLETGAPTVVVLVNGAPVEIPWADRPAAILEAYLGGQAGGSAIVDVLTGVREPGGRLPESFPSAMTDLPADANFPGAGQQVQYREGFHVGYRFHDTAGVPARFPFGHGLSYTSFEWGEPRLGGAGTDLTVQVEVTNNGDRAGSEVVQVYVRKPESRIPRPAKELRGFAKLHLEPGATGTAEIELDRRAFAHWQPGTGWVVEPGTYEVVVAASSVDVRGILAVEVQSDDHVEALPPVPTLADDGAFGALLGRPIPAPDPVRPFHRNSTLAEISDTRLGRLLGKTVTTMARRELGDLAENEAMAKMIESAIEDMPLRGMVGLTGGRVSPGALDRLIAVLDGRWSALFARQRVL